MSSDAVKTVRDFVSLVRGTTYKGDLVGKPGPALLGLGAIQPGGGFRETDFKTYGGDCPAKLMLLPGDLFASLKGATKDGKMIGSVARVPHSVASGRLTQDTVKLQFLQPNKAMENYLYWVLRSPQYREYCAGRAMGSAVVAMSREDFLSYEIPPLTQFRAEAVELLEEIEKRERLLRETNATLEATAQALFNSWFVDFDPVQAKQEGRAPDGMDEATAVLFPEGFEESGLGLVPKGWGVQLIDTWLDVLETGRRPKGGVSGFTEGVPSIGAESIVRIGQFDYAKTKFVSEEFFSKMKSGELQSHDVLLYKDGGKPGVFLPRVSMFGDGFPFERCGINEHVFRIRVKPPLNQAFLYFWVWSDAVMHELKHRGGKAAIPGINQSDVRELKLAVPTKDVLNAFDKLTSPLISKIFSNATQAQNLATLRDTLLPRLISGQLRLPEAEALIA